MEGRLGRSDEFERRADDDDDDYDDDISDKRYHDIADVYPMLETLN